jgi:hypothetical protein
MMIRESEKNIFLFSPSTLFWSSPIVVTLVRCPTFRQAIASFMFSPKMAIRQIYLLSKRVGQGKQNSAALLGSIPFELAMVFWYKTLIEKLSEPCERRHLTISLVDE